MNRFTLRRTVKNVLNTFSYNPTKYWIERGKILYKEKPYDGKQFRDQEKELINFFSSLKFSSVLEIGYGYGRITKLVLASFPQIVKYTGIDISTHNQLIAKKYVNSDKADLKVSAIQDFNSIEKYDLVFSVYVLMHVPPSNIQEVVNKCIILSKQHVVNVDWYSEPKPKIHLGHNFVHEYVQIYKKNPAVINVNQIRVPIDKPPTTVFHAEIKPS